MNNGLKKVSVPFLNVWMEDRNGQYPSCTTNPNLEYQGIHHINNGNFDKIKNIYDDSFIEIETGTQFTDTPYQFNVDWWWGLVIYGDQTVFRPPYKDHVLLLGVDHLNKYLPDLCGGLLGVSLPYFWPGIPSDAYYNYCAVGYHYDIYILTRKYYVDRNWYYNGANNYNLLTSAHELGHCIASRDFFMDNEKNYGLMNYDDRDSRSYFHQDHIISFRAGLQHFDSESN